MGKSLELRFRMRNSPATKYPPFIAVIDDGDLPERDIPHGLIKQDLHALPLSSRLQCLHANLELAGLTCVLCISLATSDR